MRTETRRPEHGRWSKVFLAQVVLYTIRVEAQLATRSAGPAAGALDTRSCGEVWAFGWRQSLRGKRRECRATLEECLTREALVRAEAQAPEVASQPDADVPEGC